MDLFTLAFIDVSQASVLRKGFKKIKEKIAKLE